MHWSHCVAMAPGLELNVVLLVQELLDEGNTSGAASVVRKIYEAAEIPFEQNSLDGDSNAAWISLFSDALRDTLEDAVP